MKRVILAALLVSVGIQCGNSFSGKSLEDFKAVCDSDFNKIKETPEYQLVEKLDAKRELDHLIARINKDYESSKAQCELFRKNGAGWFSGPREIDCIFAQMEESILTQVNSNSTEMNKEIEALLEKNPTLKEICLPILALEKQKAANLLEKSAQ